MTAVHPIRAYRNDQGLTQGELATALDVTRTTVARWETHKRKVDLRLVPKVSKKTGISQGELRPDLAGLMADQAESMQP